MPMTIDCIHTVQSHVAGCAGNPASSDVIKTFSRPRPSPVFKNKIKTLHLKTKTFCDVYQKPTVKHFSFYSRSSKRSIRQTAYDFLQAFYSNYGPIWCRFQDKRRFQSKIAKFSQPLYFAPPLKGSPWNWRWVHKTILMGLPGREGSLTISSAVWIQFTNVTDGQTDTGRQQRPRLRIASRGNQSTETKNTSQK